MSILAESIANDLHAQGTKFFEIKDGFFYSNRRAPQITLPVEDPKYIRSSGDVLLRVYCDKGSVSLYWPCGSLDEDGNEIPVLIGQHIEVFKDGYPLANGANMPTYKKSEPDAQVWATFEVLGETQRKALSSWADSSDKNRGIKICYGEDVWQIVGRMDPGHSVNTIVRVKY